MTKFYIGSGFDNEQFLIATNFVKLNSDECVFDLYTDQILEPWFRDKLKQHLGVNIIQFNYPIFYSFWLACIAIFFLPLVLSILCRSNNLLLFNRWPWINIIFHSIYDTAYRYSPSSSTKPTIRQLSLATIRCGIASGRALFLAQGGFKCFISGHNVYQFKLFNYILSHFGSVYIQGRSCLRKINLNNLMDSPLLLPPGFTIDSIKVSEDSAEQFWELRRLGGTRNQEFLLANSGKAFESSSLINIVFCHVFHDSPFFTYPGARLFADFVDWIAQTVQICAASDEEWLLRVHPSCYSWGENSKIILEKIISKHAPGAKNIKIIENDYSVESLVKASNRIVTYSGTIQLEAAIAGKRPVVAGGGLLAQYAKDFAFIPSTIEDYKKFLLGDYDYKLPPNSRGTLLRLAYGSDYCRTYEPLLGLSKKVGGDITPADIERLLLRLEVHSNVLLLNSKKLFNKGYIWFCAET